MQIREKIGLPPNLPPCLGVRSHMLIGPHPHSSSTISPASVPNPYGFLSDYNATADGYGNEIPNWFNHQSNGNSISFLIGPEIPTIALCVAIKLIDGICNFNYHFVISINGSKRLFERKSSCLQHGDRLVLSCRLQSSLRELFEDLNLGDRNLVQIFCETSNMDSGKIAPVTVITRVGVYVECICRPQKSRGCQISKSIVQQNRRRLSLLHGSSFIMRKQYNTKQPTRSTFFQPLLKARKVSKKRNRPLEARICTGLCLAQTHCQCPKELGSTYSTEPTSSVHSGYSDSRIISSAMDGGESSTISLLSNSGLSMDVTNGSEFDFGFQSTLGDGFDMGSSSLNDDSDFSPYPQSKKMRPS